MMSSNQEIINIGKLLTEDPNIFNEDVEKTDLAEGHHYLRKTSRSAEKRLNRANERAAKSSGMPNFQHLDAARNDLLGEIEKQRPLRRSEFINKYGYEKWLAYVKKHNLPENHKWADS